MGLPFNALRMLEVDAWVRKSGLVCYLVVFTRLYVPARALRISCSVQRFSTGEEVCGRAVTRVAQARSFAGRLVKCMVYGVLKSQPLPNRGSRAETGKFPRTKCSTV